MASSPVSSGSPASTASSTPAPTRGRPSVQALLAELSDSDDDTLPKTNTVLPKSAVEAANRELSEGEDSEDDLPVGGGRLASRLAGVTAAQTKAGAAKELSLQNGTSTAPEQGGATSPMTDASGEDGTTSQPKKRLLLKRKRTSDENDKEQRQQQSASPRHRSPAHLEQKSPTPTRSADRVVRSPSPDTLTHEEEPSANTGKSRFQMLVEKARKEREAREQAEQAKKAARAAQMTTSSPQKRRPRGSSPADDSEEDSDGSHLAAARKLTKDARPTRKASKKALEEMNRETQRMTRNMQLAHQARTKKKFTKESFFASFRGSLPVVAEIAASEQNAQPLNSSASSSDTENNETAKLHITPPTSPLRSPILNKTTEPVVVDNSIMCSGALQESLDDTVSFEDIFASRRTDSDKPETIVERGILRKAGRAEPHGRASAFSVRNVTSHNDSGSDSDIEVVFDTGHRRKYAAFENLPKKKAKEMPSHLALRSLAHIRQSKDKKSTMSGAEIGPALLKAARRQAWEERHEKIAKLKAAGVIIQTAEEKEQAEEELEDLVERARQEDEEIRKREKEQAKKDGTYTKDALDEDDSDDEDEDFQDEDQDEDARSGSDEEGMANDEDGEDEIELESKSLVDDAAEESAEDVDSEDELVSGSAQVAEADAEGGAQETSTPMPSRVMRKARVILDNDDDDEDEGEDVQRTIASPALPMAGKTPQSVLRSTRKIIPGLQHSDDLPIGLTQAFAATMAESQTQDREVAQEQDSMDILRDLPSPHISLAPRLNRIESLDLISESVPGTQTQPLGLDFGLSQTQRVPESPSTTHHIAASQAPFDLTQDEGYSFSPFAGNRFAETPRREPHSTEETIILPPDESPFLQRKGKLQRGRQASQKAEDDAHPVAQNSAFHVMNKAARRKAIADFNKKQSEARRAVDEAAEESDDEYAGLGGASDDDSNDEEDEDDRRMIDEDTQVGQGDEAKLAKLYADKEREADEAAVNKMMKDIATGALRRKRAVGDDLDLSDEEDAATRRREAKRREFAKMRRELLKDEAVGKIADDKKKQAFLKSIEDHEVDDEEDDDFDQPETQNDTDSQEQSQSVRTQPNASVADEPSKILKQAKDSQLNQVKASVRRTKYPTSRKPGTLAEIRESVSFLIEEPDSQAGILDLGLSDSEEEPEAYVNLDRHLQQAEADEEAMNDENEDLGGFVVDDEDDSVDGRDVSFKKPELPTTQRDRAPFSERRTKSVNVVDRLSLLRQASSSASTSGASSKMAFFSSKAGSGTLSNVPNLLRRATTNSGLGSMSGRETVSATGVVTSKTERGSAAQEKDFVRKGASTSRNAVNYQGRQSLKEEKMSARAGIAKKQQKRKGSGFLGSLFRGDSWA